MRFDSNGGQIEELRAEQLRRPGPDERAALWRAAATGVSGTYEWDKRETDDFAQAGALYRLIDDAAKQRLVDNIADGLAQVGHSAIVDRSVSCFRGADPDYGDRIEQAVAARRS